MYKLGIFGVFKEKAPNSVPTNFFPQSIQEPYAILKKLSKQQLNPDLFDEVHALMDKIDTDNNGEIDEKFKSLKGLVNTNIVNPIFGSGVGYKIENEADYKIARRLLEGVKGKKLPEWNKMKYLVENNQHFYVKLEKGTADNNIMIRTGSSQSNLTPHAGIIDNNGDYKPEQTFSDWTTGGEKSDISSINSYQLAFAKGVSTHMLKKELTEKLEKQDFKPKDKPTLMTGTAPKKIKVNENSTLAQMQKNVDDIEKWNKEVEEWNAKSKELTDSKVNEAPVLMEGEKPSNTIAEKVDIQGIQAKIAKIEKWNKEVEEWSTELNKLDDNEKQVITKYLQSQSLAQINNEEAKTKAVQFLKVAKNILQTKKVQGGLRTALQEQYKKADAKYNLYSSLRVNSTVKPPLVPKESIIAPENSTTSSLPNLDFDITTDIMKAPQFIQKLDNLKTDDKTIAKLTEMYREINSKEGKEILEEYIKKNPKAKESIEAKIQEITQEIKDQEREVAKDTMTNKKEIQEAVNFMKRTYTKNKVKAIQELTFTVLKEKGASVDAFGVAGTNGRYADGLPGPRTAQAIKDVQMILGITTPTGMPDKKTLAALGNVIKNSNTLKGDTTMLADLNTLGIITATA